MKISISFLVFLYPVLCMLHSGSSSNVDVPPAYEGLLCNEVSCGQGRCKAVADSPFRFDCDCLRGWKQAPSGFGGWLLPPCLLPNCSLDLDCNGNKLGAPAPAPAPASVPPSMPPSVNIWDPCSYVFCGDGSCVATGADKLQYRCDCNEGSANFKNVTTAACVKQCSLGGNCANLDVELLTPDESTRKSDAAKHVSSYHLLLTMLLFLSLIR